MKSRSRYIDYNRPVAVCCVCYTLGKWHCYNCGKDFCALHFNSHKCVINNVITEKDSSKRSSK